MRHSPYQMGLTPFEIMYGVPAPIVSNLQSAATAELEDDDLLFGARATQWAHKHVWPKLRDLEKQAQFQNHISSDQETGFT